MEKNSLSLDTHLDQNELRHKIGLHVYANRL